MTWEYWLIALSIGIIALAFLALVIFLSMVLISVRRTVQDLDQKVHAFDPLFRIVSKTGCAIEKRTHCVKQLAHEVDEDEPPYEEKETRTEKTINTALEIAEWALIGVALWQKVKKRR